MTFESTAPAEVLLRGFAEAIKGHEPGEIPVPATLEMRGTVNEAEITVHRNPVLSKPRVEFQGIVASQPGGSMLVGAYRDLRAPRRLSTWAAFIAFSAISVFSAIRDWDTNSAVNFGIVIVAAAALTLVFDRFHALNRNSGRDLLRSDIETVIRGIEGG